MEDNRKLLLDEVRFLINGFLTKKCKGGCEENDEASGSQEGNGNTRILPTPKEFPSVP